MTEWSTNTGFRPGSLSEGDQIHVRLNNGNEHGPWIVRGNSPLWGLRDENDPTWLFAIKEWRKV